uniref:Uncharacterized protein n=1 Tax=Anguilla anguilla TaxID=7936 RepID=A0A0E9S7M5_ANGAN
MMFPRVALLALDNPSWSQIAIASLAAQASPCSARQNVHC